MSFFILYNLIFFYKQTENVFQKNSCTFYIEVLKYNPVDANSYRSSVIKIRLILGCRFFAQIRWLFMKLYSDIVYSFKISNT